MKNLLDFPTETLQQIMEDVDDPDLKSMRLVCKLLRDVALKRFGLAYFHERAHIISQESIQALLNITANDTFGPFVKIVKISGARLTRVKKEVCLNDLYLIPKHDESEFVISDQFFHLMEEVFFNIKKHTGSVIISVWDDHTAPFKIFMPYIAKDIKPSYKWKQDIWKTPYHVVYRMEETLEEVIAAARSIGCPIRGIKILLNHPFHNNPQDYLRKALDEFLTAEPNANIYLRYQLDMGLWELERIQQRKKLKLTTVDFTYPTLDNPKMNPDTVRRWLHRSEISEVDLEHCFIGQTPLLYALSACALESINLDRPTVEFGPDEYHWSGVLKQLSTIPSLKRFCIFKPYYQCDLYRDSQHSSTGQETNAVPILVVELSDDFYESNHIETLELRFPQDSDRLELSGDDVPRKLEIAASYVTAAETEKVYEIKTKGRLDEWVRSKNWDYTQAPFLYDSED